MIEARERHEDSRRPTIQTPSAALSEYRRHVLSAGEGDTVWAQAMIFHFGSESIAPLIPAWQQASDRGAHVYLAADTLSTYVAYDGHQHPLFKQGDHTFQEIRESESKIIAKELAHPRIHVVALKPSYPMIPSFPAGRNHIKGYGVLSSERESVAWLPTHNLDDTGIIEDSNLAARFSGAREARTLFTAASLTHTSTEAGTRLSQRKHDFMIDMGHEMNLIVDVGRPMQSSVYDRNMRMVKRGRPDRVVFASQFPPDPFMLRRLSEHAKRGTQVDFFTTSENHPLTSPHHMRILNARLKHEAERQPSFTIHRLPDELMHIKALTLEKDGEVVEASFGTHNLFYPTVAVGTAEMQLYSRNREFNREIVKGVESAAAI